MKRFLYPLILFTGFTALLAFRFSDDRWKAPEDAKKLTNPLKASSGVVMDGKYLFKLNCKGCHGSFGQGDGPLAKTLKARTADLTSDDVQDQTDGELYYKLSVGRAEMPAFKDILKPEERWSLIHYIRTLNAERESSAP
jgi:mono/diheme cytochrome c family protein